MPSLSMNKWRANTSVEMTAVFWVAAVIVGITIGAYPTADAFMIFARSRAAQSGAEHW